MLFFHRPENPPVGLEINPGGVRMLQVLPSDDGSPAVAVSQRPLAASVRGGAASHPAVRIRAAAELARGMLSEGPFVGRRVVAALPDEFVQIKTLRLPVSEPERTPSDDLVRQEARNAFPFDLSGAHLQYLYAGQTRYGSELRHEVVAAACPTDRIELFAGELDRVGLKVASVDIAPCAVYRGIEWACPDREAVHAVIDMGEDLTRVIIGQGGRIRFIKGITFGTNPLWEAVSRRLGITVEEAGQLRRRLIDSAGEGAPEREAVRKAVRQACRALLESLASDVVLCLRYYRVSFRGRQPERVQVVGAEAADPQICSVLASVAGLEAAPGRPLLGLDLSRVTPADRRHSMSDWALALGLALRAMPRPATVVPADSHIPSSESENIAA